MLCSVVTNLLLWSILKMVNMSVSEVRKNGCMTGTISASILEDNSSLVIISLKTLMNSLI